MLAEPGGDPLPDRPGGAPPQGEEADAEVLQPGEHRAGGEAGVEQQIPGQLAGDLAAGVNQGRHGLVPVQPAHAGGGEVEGVLCDGAAEEGSQHLPGLRRPRPARAGQGLRPPNTPGARRPVAGHRSAASPCDRPRSFRLPLARRPLRTAGSS